VEGRKIKLIDVRGWLEIREELTTEIEAFLNQVKVPSMVSLLEDEQKQFIHRGWSWHPVDKGNSYFFSYLYYGGNFQEDALPYFHKTLEWHAKEWNYWDGPLRVYPTGEFVIEDGEGEYFRRLEVKNGVVEAKPFKE
jgi:hypothetical protein